jgi:hypothetical protein
MSLKERIFLRLFGPSLGCLYVTYLFIRDLWLRVATAIAGRGLVIQTVGDCNDKMVALIATQAAGGVPKSIEVVVDLLAWRGCAVLLVCNGRLGEAALARLRPKLWRVIERPNYGRDFGAYKAGVMHLMRENIVPERLVVLNDSVFYDSKRAGAMFDRLIASPAPFVAATENHEPNFHVGSFLFAVTAAVQRSAAWRNYWRTYHASSSRLHAIRYGELGLSRALIKKGGFFPEVLYSTNDLASWMRGWTIEDLSRRLNRLPKELRENLRKAELESEFRDSASISGDIINLAANSDPGEILTRLQSTEARAARRLRLSRVIDEMLAKMERRSQIHWAGALFIERLGLGMMKKDCAYREVYDINDIFQIMEEFGYPDMSEVSYETRKRGSPVSMRGVSRALYRLGYI